MTFAVHIPIVGFGIAFPALVILVEWLHLRTGDPVYLTLAKRWSKVIGAHVRGGLHRGATAGAMPSGEPCDSLCARYSAIGVS